MLTRPLSDPSSSRLKAVALEAQSHLERGQRIPQCGVTAGRLHTVDKFNTRVTNAS